MSAVKILTDYALSIGSHLEDLVADAIINLAAAQNSATTNPKTILTAIGSGTMALSGYSGRSGFSGRGGLSGYCGISGYSAASSGYSGFSGFSGKSGYSGRSGYSGFSGA